MKRLFDIVVTLLAMPVVLPASLAIAIAIWMKLGRPVLFIQERPGLGGRPFRLFKFRTMNDSRSPDGALLPDADRLTGLPIQPKALCSAGPGEQSLCARSDSLALG